MRLHVSALAVLAAGGLLGSAVTALSVPATAASDPPAGTGRTYDIVVTDQARDQITVLDGGDRTWTVDQPADSVKWAWKPTPEQGFADLTDNWGLPDEAKLRHHQGRRYLLTTDSYGLAAVVPYPSGKGAYWAADVGRPANPHSIEILPDGNVAVAASTGGWVRVYTASQGRDSTEFAEFELPGAHGAVWDGERELLWASADHEVVGLRIGGSPSEPTITEEVRYDLPTPWGHDLTPIKGDPDHLWVTSGSRVYLLDLDTGEFSSDYPGAATIDTSGVKSVSTHPGTGQVLTTKSEPGTPCTWCTPTVRMHVPTDHRTLPGGEIYKARWWVDTVNR